jgi:hypothetical protein
MRFAYLAATGLAVCIVSTALPIQTQIPIQAQAAVQLPNEPDCVVTAKASPEEFIGQVLYAGQLDGLIGSEKLCKDLDLVACNAEIKTQGDKLHDFRAANRGILVATGDDLGPFGFGKTTNTPDSYDPDKMIALRTKPDYSTNAMVDFLQAFDALVPGKEEFAWGAEYLRKLGYRDPDSTSPPPLPLIADNLTIQPKPDPECLSFPSPNAALPLQPNQVSSPISSPGTSGTGMGGGGSSAGVAGGTGASGGGGGKKGKGGGGGAAGGCPGSTTASVTGGTPASAPSSASTLPNLSLKQQEAMNNLLRPQLISPNGQSFYSWTTSIAVSVPEGMFDEGARVCPADSDLDKVDEIEKGKECIDWKKVSPLLDTQTYEELQAVQTAPALPTLTEVAKTEKPGNNHGKTGSGTVIPGLATKTFQIPAPDEMKKTNYFPVNPDGTIKANPEGNNFNTGELFSGNLVKVCLTLNPRTPELQALLKKLEPKWKSGDVLCTFSPIDVQRVLFNRAWIIPTPSETALADRKTYVIFGALASDSLNGVSETNREWWPAKQAAGQRLAPTMQVNIGDQNAALSQALAAFNLLHPDPKDVYTGVVLAQMTPAEARTLADGLAGTSTGDQAKTTVKLIISAADAVESSPEATIKIPLPPADDKQKKERTDDERTKERFVPVLSPAPSFQKNDCAAGENLSKGECIAHAVFTRASCQNRLVVENVPAEIPPPPASPNEPKKSLRAPSANKAFCDAQPIKTWECQVLKDMIRSMYDSFPDWYPDLAMLVAKDIDYVRSGILPDSDIAPGSDEKPSDSQALEALWNAGNLTRVTLMGSTLTTILNQMSSNQTQTFQTIASTARSQQLKVLGVFKVGESYYVNGMRLDANKCTWW